MKIVIFVQKKIKPNTKQKMKDFLKYMLAAMSLLHREAKRK